MDSSRFWSGSGPTGSRNIRDAIEWERPTENGIRPTGCRGTPASNSALHGTGLTWSTAAVAPLRRILRRRSLLRVLKRAYSDIQQHIAVDGRAMNRHEFGARSYGSLPQIGRAHV